MRDARLNWPQLINRPPKDGSPTDSSSWLGSRATIALVTVWWNLLVAENQNYESTSEIIKPNLEKVVLDLKNNNAQDFPNRIFVQLFTDWIKRNHLWTADSEACGHFVAGLIVPLVVDSMEQFDLAAALFAEHGNYLFFVDTLSIELRSKPVGIREHWCSFLKQRENLPYSLMQFFRGEEDSFRGVMYEHSENPKPTITFDTIWSSLERSHLRGKPQEMRRLQLLCALSFEDFIKFFELIPTVEAQGMVFRELSLDRDPELIQQWLELAPNAVSANNRCIQSSTFLFGVNAIVNYARALHHAVTFSSNRHGLGTMNNEIMIQAQIVSGLLESEELPNWFNKSISTVLKRVDGKLVLIDFALELIHRAMYMKPTGLKKPWTAEDAAINYISQALSNQSNITNTIRERYNFFNDLDVILGRVSPGNLILLAVLCQKDDSFDGEALWGWYSSLLQNQDKSILGHVNRYGQTEQWVFDLIGSILLHCSDAVKKIDKLWRDLYYQRYSSRFKVITGDELGVCRHLLKVLIGTLNQLLVQENRNNDLEKRVLNAAIQSAWTLYFSNGEMTYLDDASDVSLAFCYVPAIFGDDWPEIVKERIEGLKCEPELTIRVAGAIATNNISPAIVTETFSKLGIEIRKDLLKIEKWHQASGYKNKIPFDLDMLKKLFL